MQFFYKYQKTILLFYFLTLPYNNNNNIIIINNNNNKGFNSLKGFSLMAFQEIKPTEIDRNQKKKLVKTQK